MVVSREGLDLAIVVGRHQVDQIMTLPNPLFLPDWRYADFISPAGFASQGVLNKDLTFC